MKKNKTVRTALCVILAAAVLTAFAAMAGSGAGSQTDPLVSLSYLTDTFTPQIMEKVDSLLEERNAALNEELRQPAAGDGAYAVVTLSAGQALRGEAGCEVLLRSGDARCAGELADATSGGVLAGGGLTANHLYLMPDSRSITTADGATLLARGSYAIQ